jgi:hypothetical protein
LLTFGTYYCSAEHPQKRVLSVMRSVPMYFSSGSIDRAMVRLVARYKVHAAFELPADQ